MPSLDYYDSADLVSLVHFFGTKQWSPFAPRTMKRLLK
jgi:hypothetical protein